jgi:peptide/nickel transport system substrate-binding protein
VENIYEKLIAFDGPHLDKFIPILAVRVPTMENGDISPDGKVYKFQVRPGINFQEGGQLTASDVEYSIERVMVLDQSGGPAWLLLEALTGEGSTTGDDGKPKPGIFKKIMSSVETDGDTVIFKLPRPYPPFMGIMAKSWASVVDKEWVVAKGGWNGTLDTAARFNCPSPGQETLFKITNGTGPYKMAFWEPSKMFAFERYED